MSLLKSHMAKCFVLLMVLKPHSGYAAVKGYHAGILPSILYLSQSSINYFFPKPSYLRLPKSSKPECFDLRINQRREKYSKKFDDSSLLPLPIECHRELMKDSTIENEGAKALQELVPLHILKDLAQAYAFFMERSMQNQEALYQNILEKLIELSKKNGLTFLTSSITFADITRLISNSDNNSEITKQKNSTEQPSDPAGDESKAATAADDESKAATAADEEGKAATATAEEEEEEEEEGNPTFRRILTYDTKCHSKKDTSAKITSHIKSSVPVSNLTDFEAKVTDFAKEGKFDIICIDGHGAQDSQGVGGSGKSYGNENNDLDPKHLEKQKELLRRVKENCLREATEDEPRLPIVALMGCHIAPLDLNEESLLLKGLSQILTDTIVMGFNHEMSCKFTDRRKYTVVFTAGAQQDSSRVSLIRARIYLNDEEIFVSNLVEIFGEVAQELIEGLLFEWESTSKKK